MGREAMAQPPAVGQTALARPDVNLQVSKQAPRCGACFLFATQRNLSAAAKMLATLLFQG
jgi:hypothetical protein